jgi:hypothetical protein
MHELKGKRLRNCRRFTHFIRRGIDILDTVFCRDEAWFHLSGYVNSQNSRIWSELCISNVTAETLHLVASNMRKRVNACTAEGDLHFHYLILHCFSVSWYQCNLFFFCQIEHVSGMGCVTFRSLFIRSIYSEAASSQLYVRTLIESMPRRVRSVVESQGFWTSY